MVPPTLITTILRLYPSNMLGLCGNPCVLLVEGDSPPLADSVARPLTSITNAYTLRRSSWAAAPFFNFDFSAAFAVGGKRKRKEDTL